MHTKLSEDVAEILEAVWTMEEKNLASIEDLRKEAPIHVSYGLLSSARRARFLTVDDENRVRFTEKGREAARQIIRRHRLAERLTCDVLGIRVEESEEAACEFEHIIAEGITNSICTLLGHPRYCPHNRAIPEGDCCRKAREELRPIVVSCAQLSVGETARVAYVSTRHHARILRLCTMGITPGVQIKLLQKWPSYVIQSEETEIAIEEEVAGNIFVWRTPDE